MVRRKSLLLAAGLLLLLAAAPLSAQQPNLPAELGVLRRLPPVDGPELAAPLLAPVAPAPAAEELPPPAGEPEAVAEPPAEPPPPAEKPADKPAEKPADKPAEKKPAVDKTDAAAVEVKVAEPEPFSHRKFWKGKVDFGISGTQGPRDTSSMTLGAKATYTRPEYKHTYEFSYIDRTTDNRTVAHRKLIDGRIEWPLPGRPWSYYVHGEGEYDRFRPFDYRASGDTGISYQLFDKDRFFAFLDADEASLLGRFGGSFSKEVGGRDDRYVPELTTGLEWKHKITSRHRLEAAVDYFPDVTDPSDFRLNTRASYEVIVDPDWGLSIRFRLTDRYDSTSEASKRSVRDYAATLTWSF